MALDLLHGSVLAVAGFAAGVINAVAGGGSLLTFPALIWSGLPPVVANATNTVAVWPGTISSTWAYRDVLRGERTMALGLAPPALLGGLLGALLLLNTSEAAFEGVVPWLIVFACLVLAAQEPLSRLARRVDAPVGPARVDTRLWITQLLISIYGGYFGAGQGIITLAAFAILVPGGLQNANALKVLTAFLVNAVAAMWFLWVGATSLPEVCLMAVASYTGGIFGARVAKRLPARVMRLAVVSYGLFVAAVMALR